MTAWKAGDRVYVRQSVEAFPHFIALPGFGTVSRVDEHHVWVLYDEWVDGCEEWGNEVQFGPDGGCDDLDRVAVHCPQVEEPLVDVLVAQYNAWGAREGFTDLPSADELIARDEFKTQAQRRWVEDFIVRWNAMQTALDNATCAVCGGDHDTQECPSVHVDPLNDDEEENTNEREFVVTVTTITKHRVVARSYEEAEEAYWSGKSTRDEDDEDNESITDVRDTEE